MSNGTAALHLVGNAIGWDEDDIVITSPITFLASANSILYSGVTPDFLLLGKKINCNVKKGTAFNWEFID